MPFAAVKGSSIIWSTFMEILHRFTFSGSSELIRQLESLSVKFEKTDGLHGNFLITFEISESESIWLDIERLAETFGAADLMSTVFSCEEILEAQWLTIERTHYQGYPQPEKIWLREHPNYQDYCPQCGTHKQVGSFVLKKEPFLRQNDFMSLFWTGAVFAKHEIFDSFMAHQILGFQKVDALLQKTKLPSTIVAQMMHAVTAHPGLIITEDLTGMACGNCGVTKYLPFKKGRLKLRRELLPENIDIFATQEWFGDGAMAFREILVSQRVAELAVKQKWKGLQLKVVDLV